MWVRKTQMILRNRKKLKNKTRKVKVVIVLAINILMVPITHQHEEKSSLAALFFILLKRKNSMLVLGRKPGEYVMRGKDIMVKVIKSDERDLRIAIEAPKDVNIIRGEIYEDRSRYIHG